MRFRTSERGRGDKLFSIGTLEGRVLFEFNLKFVVAIVGVFSIAEMMLLWMMDVLLMLNVVVLLLL